jgi:hypothetical protein
MAITLPDRPATQRDSLPGRREQTVELAVFLFLILPSLVLSLFVVRQGGMSFVLTGRPDRHALLAGLPRPCPGAPAESQVSTGIISALLPTTPVVDYE